MDAALKPFDYQLIADTGASSDTARSTATMVAMILGVGALTAMSLR